MASLTSDGTPSSSIVPTRTPFAAAWMRCMRTGFEVPPPEAKTSVTPAFDSSAPTTRALSSVRVATRSTPSTPGMPGPVAVEVGVVEELLAGRLRRGPRVVRLGEQVGEELLVDPARRRVPAVSVVPLLTTGHPHDGGVDEGVCGSEVVRVRLGVRVDHGHVGDAAEVERGAARPSGEEQHVEGRDQRGALPTGGDVGGAMVGEDRASGRLRERPEVAELQPTTGAPVLDPVEDGLPVRADEVASRCVERRCHLAEVLADEDVERAHLGDRRAVRRQCGGDALAELGGVGHHVGRDDASPREWSRSARTRRGIRRRRRGRFRRSGR